VREVVEWHGGTLSVQTVSSEAQTIVSLTFPNAPAIADRHPLIAKHLPASI